MEIRKTIENDRKNPPEILPKAAKIDPKIQKIVKQMYDGLRCAQTCEKLAVICEKVPNMAPTWPLQERTQNVAGVRDASSGP